jgi:2OG-Fe(II) oxygenase superfamily
MLSFNNVNFLYEPYPIGVAAGVFEEQFYKQLVESFPPVELFSFMPLLGNKYSLSEVNNPDAYHEYVRTTPVWNEFHRWIKREEFPGEILAMLRQHNIDLHVPNQAASNGSGGSRLKRLVFGELSPPPPTLSARFEFSMLPAHGGFIKPHTDSPQKIITLVVAMLSKGEWDPAFGGGTDVLRPKDITRNYNFKNDYLEFDEVETLTTFEYQPNQCVIFIKTFNSLHAVRPMTAQGGQLMRRTLTVNIEKVL